MRIALLGGSFDPIHKGHLKIAKTALKKLAIDEVWFMPAYAAPLKDGANADFHDRCHMIQLAIRPYRHMRLCDIEGKRCQRSYTIHTIEQLQACYPQHSFCFLIGDDQALHFDEWKDAQRLKTLIPFYVFSRTEQEIDLPKGMKRITMDLISISSSEIRKGHHLYMLPKAVLTYIGRHGLYLNEMIQDKMNEKRYIHSCSVAQLCIQLAAAHHLDETAAYIMGITHDIAKQMPKAKAEIWMRHHLPQHLDEASAIWHGYIGADYIKKHFHINDKRVCEAIFHHVKGRNKTDYDRILFIADKLDPSRGYDSSKEITLSMKDLKAGFEVVKQLQQDYLKQEGKI